MVESILHCRAVRALRGEAQRHGIALEALLRMLEAQNYACSICARVMVNDTFKQAAAEPTGEIEWAPVQRKSILATPHVDYCPKTGVVRGLVCVACLKLLASATEPLELLQKCIVIIKQPKWVNPRPNRRRIRRKRKSHIARKEMLNTRLIPRERRVRLLDYFARELDESLVSECWRAGLVATRQERRKGLRPVVPDVEPDASDK